MALKTNEFTRSRFELMKTKGVAQLFNVSNTTVLEWVHKGILPAFKIKYTCRFRREDIERFVEE